MQYLITMLEGIISFVSPCMLPMLPVYITYFAGGNDGKRSPFPRALGFVLGFTAVFCLLGLFAGTLGSALKRYERIVEIVCGTLVIVFGLSYLDIIPLNFLKGVQGSRSIGSVWGAFLFGLIYAVNLTPCVGAFLGSALMLAATGSGALEGLTLLLAYAAGLGIPFLLSAVLIGSLSGVFRFIKRHYAVIDRVSGIFLIVIGAMMAAGVLGKWIRML